MLHLNKRAVFSTVVLFAVIGLALSIITTTANSATFSVVHEFSGTDGAMPVGGLLIEPSGVIYGTTSNEVLSPI